MYEYKCPEGHRFTRFRKIAEYQAVEKCDCGAAANRVLSAPMVKGDYPGYECPISGKWIEGRKAHEENLAKHGCRVYESGETQEFMKRKEAEEAAFESRIESTAEEFVEKLPTRKREQLAAEMESGLTATVVRQ
jgi:putative FmdB family regulatory protein